MEHVKAPDFPTGGTIYGTEGVKNAFETGKGRIVMRGKAEFDVSKSGREQIVITEVPYQVSPSQIIVKAVDLVNDKVIEGISEVRDESGRQGLRIVFDLKRDAIPNIVLNKLFKYTPLQTSFSVNNIALVNGRPEMLNLKDMIHHYVDHRHEVVVRRTKYLLKEAEKRAHILEGLIIALDNLDAVIKLIRASKNAEDARNGLMKEFELSQIQAKAILDMRLQKLTGLEIEKVRAEYAELMATIADLKDILSDESRRMQIIKDDLLEMKSKYGDDRRTNIEFDAGEINIEDLIANEEMVVTISSMGYIKRTPLTEYKSQSRGGVGNKGVKHRDKDFVEHLFVTMTHNYILLFTDQGRCFWMKVYEIPEGSKVSQGRAIQNLINIPSEDTVRAFVATGNLKDEDYVNNNYIVMCTKNGTIKKTSLEQYSRPRTNGINAITIREGDQLLEAKLTNGTAEVLLAKKSGKAIRFNESGVRPMGRTASGVRGVRLENDQDEVIGMVCVNESEDNDTSIMVVSEKGYGKRTDIGDYRITGRGGKGVKTLSVTEKTGSLIAIKDVTDENDLMIITRNGIAIRMKMEDVRVMGRATQGVRLIKIRDNDNIASVARVPKVDEEEEAEENQEVNSDDSNNNEENNSNTE
jgi:DNA gyrase subunit A